jgi:hypothetical protein
VNQAQGRVVINLAPQVRPACARGNLTSHRRTARRAIECRVQSVGSHCYSAPLATLRFPPVEIRSVVPRGGYGGDSAGVTGLFVCTIRSTVPLPVSNLPHDSGSRGCALRPLPRHPCAIVCRLGC